MLRTRFAVPFALCSLIASANLAAHADVTVVSKVTSSGVPGRMGGRGPGAPAPATTETTINTFYKGRKVRTEMQQRVLIYDGATNKLYALDPSNQTYRTLSSDMANPFMRMMKMDTTATVKPTGATRTIAGRVAREYTVSADIEMSMNAGAMGGGFGAPGGAPPPAGQQHVGSIKVEGQQWVAPIASLPNGGSDAMRASAQAANSVPGMKALMEKLATIKGFPLASRQTVTTRFSFPGAPPTAAAKQGIVVTSSTDTVSVQEGPLSDALFAIPAGYHSAPIAPGRPGGGRGRPMSAPPVRP